MTTIDKIYVSNKVNDLVTEREHWEKNEFLASNKVLYGLLAKCMSLAVEIAESRKLQNQLNDVLTKNDVRITLGTPLITKVIKLVFGSERKRASAYSLAIRVAKKAQVTPDQLEDWLIEQGGIEEVRAVKASGGGDKPKARREKMQTLGEKFTDQISPLAIVPKSAGTPESVGPTLILARVEADHSSSVLCFVDNETLVKAALEFIGKQSEKDEQKDSNEGSAAVSAALDAVSESEQPTDEEAA